MSRRRNRRRHHVPTLLLGLIAAGFLIVKLLGSSNQVADAIDHARHFASVPPVASSTSSPGEGTYRLVQYPADGLGGFYNQTRAAKRSISMEMYELADTTEEHDLVAAAARGVDVRVLLDKDFNGGEVNQAAYTYLEQHGVHVRWAPAGYIFHIKATVFDHKTADISTANLTAKYYSDTRDAEVIDTNPTQVHAVEATFNSDYAAAPGGKPAVQTHQAPGLVWSPNTGPWWTAQTAMVYQINSARHSVEFTSEELSDPAIYNALAADARRGVTCRVVMTNSSDWDTGFTAVSRAGCSVHVFPDSTKALYMHEKLVLDDHGTRGQSLLIGSQNASDYSLTRNRELSVLLHNNQAHMAINAAAATFAKDYASSSCWKPGRCA